MLPSNNFKNLPSSFWAHVRLISQLVGYTQQGKTGLVKAPSLHEIVSSFKANGLSASHLTFGNNQPSQVAQDLIAYFAYRADVLNNVVQHQLMNEAQAAECFDALYKRLNPKCPIPLNKQKGEKKKPAYLTGMVNMLIESHLAGAPCDYDPRSLTLFTANDVPLRTLSRRVDGAFPSSINPVAIWEIKEYYFTTTFGSRVADGVYETLLDGMELEELQKSEGVEALHYLFVDAHYTWWECGRSYLCRMIDMLHMGYVDEIMFGKEIVESLPVAVEKWVDIYRSR